MAKMQGQRAEKVPGLSRANYGSAVWQRGRPTATPIVRRWCRIVLSERDGY